MGSDQSKPVAGQKMRANEREIRQYRLKQRAHPLEGIGRVEQVYSDQDGSGIISDYFGRWTIVFATAFAIAAMICLVLPAFFGTPLTSEGFQADWDNAFSNVRDIPRSDPIDAGNGFTFRFGVTGYCIVPDAKIKGAPNHCGHKWFYRGVDLKDIGVDVPNAIANALSTIAVFQFLSAIFSIILALILVVWMFVKPDYGAYVKPIGIGLVIFDLIAGIGIPAISISEKYKDAAIHDPPLVTIGNGTGLTIAGVVLTIVAVIFWASSINDWYSKAELKDSHSTSNWVKNKLKAAGEG